MVKLGIRHKCAFSPWRILIFGNIKTVFVDPTFFNLVGTAQFRDEQTRSNQLLQATFGTFNIRNCAETIYKGWSETWKAVTENGFIPGPSERTFNPYPSEFTWLHHFTIQFIKMGLPHAHPFLHRLKHTFIKLSRYLSSATIPQLNSCRSTVLCSKLQWGEKYKTIWNARDSMANPLGLFIMQTQIYEIVGGLERTSIWYWRY